MAFLYSGPHLVQDYTLAILLQLREKKKSVQERNSLHLGNSISVVFAFCRYIALVMDLRKTRVPIL